MESQEVRIHVSKLTRMVFTKGDIELKMLFVTGEHIRRAMEDYIPKNFVNAAEFSEETNSGESYSLPSMNQALAKIKHDPSQETKQKARFTALETAVRLKPSDYSNATTTPLSNSAGYDVLKKAEDIYQWLIKGL